MCFDISHAQGTDTVASMVWFQNGRPYRDEYRKFKVKTVEGIDDFASMHEVVGRYFTRRIEEERPLPDLVVIDGGKGQLNAAADALRELGLGGDADRQPRQARGGDLRPRPQRVDAPVAALPGAARCCSRRATRRTASPSPSSASDARCAPSRRSCCASPASATTSAGSCSTAFGSVQGVREATPEADRRRAGVLGEERGEDSRGASRERRAGTGGIGGACAAAPGAVRHRYGRRAVPSSIRPIQLVSSWHLHCSACDHRSRATRARPSVRPAGSPFSCATILPGRRATRSRRAGTCGATRRDAAARRREAGVASAKALRHCTSCPRWRARSASRACG